MNIDSNPKLSTKKIIGLFVITSVLFGGTFIGARAGLNDIPPILFVALRYDIASIILLSYVFVKYPQNKIMPKNRSDIIGILAAGILAIGAANGFLFIGQVDVTSAVASIVFSLIPIFSPLLATILLKDENLSIEGGIGTIVSLFGVSIVIGITPSTLSKAITLGTLFVLIGAFSTSLGSVIIRRTEPTISSTVRTAWALPISALMLHSFSYRIGESFSNINWSPVAIVSLLYVGIFAGAIAYGTYFKLLDTVGAIKSSIVFYISPVVATLGGWILLDESLSMNSIMGFFIIFLGFIIMAWKTIVPIIYHYFKQDKKQANISLSD